MAGNRTEKKKKPTSRGRCGTHKEAERAQKELSKHMEALDMS
jgi:hypothetical protein